MNREMAIKWLEKAEALSKGDQLFIPVDNKKESTVASLLFRSELKILEEVDPAVAGTLTVKSSYKDSKFWIILEKVDINPLVGFIRKADGEVVRIRLTDNLQEERKRILKIMVTDGLQDDEILEHFGKLSNEEFEFITSERRRIAECQKPKSS